MKVCERTSLSLMALTVRWGLGGGNDGKESWGEMGGGGVSWGKWGGELGEMGEGSWGK